MVRALYGLLLRFCALGVPDGLYHIGETCPIALHLPLAWQR